VPRDVLVWGRISVVGKCVGVVMGCGRFLWGASWSCFSVAWKMVTVPKGVLVWGGESAVGRCVSLAARWGEVAVVCVLKSNEATIVGYIIWVNVKFRLSVRTVRFKFSRMSKVYMIYYCQ